MIRESDGKRFLLVTETLKNEWCELVSVDRKERVKANNVMTVNGADHYVSEDGETYVVEMDAFNRESRSR